MSSTTEILSSVHSTLEAHSQLMKAVESGHRRRRELISRLPPSSVAGISFSDLANSSSSPESLRDSTREHDPHLEEQRKRLARTDLPKEKLAKVKKYQNYVPEEETIRNDYSQQYVDSGEWPQNWVLGAELDMRFEEYPKQRRLLALKQAAVEYQAHPPTHLPLASLQSLHPLKFDVILIDPPYADASRDPPYGGIAWDQIAELPIPALAADPSFIFLWVGHGNSDGLEKGREVLTKWGFRRCEDIVWVKTNKTSNKGPGTDPPPIGGIMTRTTEHCLMGIRGTVRRSNDGWFVHCNIDTDVIIWEGDPTDPLRKPPEMYSLIENFCLGTRRLELFGRASSLRRGWVTVGDIDDAAYELEKVGGKSWDREWYEADIRSKSQNGKAVVSPSSEIEQLRPKSPNRHDKTNTNSGAGTPNNQARMVPSIPHNQGMQYNQPAPIMQQAGMGNMPMQGPMFSGPRPGPMVGPGFDGVFPPNEGVMGMGIPQMMPMGIPANVGVLQGAAINPAMAIGMIGAANPFGMGQLTSNLPQGSPIRLGGGPMQGMHLPNTMGMGGGVVQNPGGNNVGAMRMGQVDPNMGIGMMNPMGMGQMPGAMGGAGMMPAMQMGVPPMQMNGMGMGINPTGNMAMGPNRMGFPNNRAWQGGNMNPQTGNWNGGANF
ncbi:hypothetical protein FS842_006184 [Serendipita sp. 407]|nr:hypothetical protein FRC18_001555 [Serendipita sp. 400]KAG9054107.1 hypothetical protein FS842_006184 [Serendipita sp. 407]